MGGPLEYRGTVFAIALLAVAVGLSNFAAAIGIGVSGVSRRTRVRVAVVFGVFEAGMPVAGLVLGHSLAAGLGQAARWLGAAALIIFGPLLVPVAAQLGIAPLHYGVVLVIAMGIGLFAPPFGVGYYAACAIARVSPDAAMRRIWPYLLAVLAGLIVVAAVPQSSETIPWSDQRDAAAAAAMLSFPSRSTGQPAAAPASPATPSPSRPSFRAPSRN